MYPRLGLIEFLTSCTLALIGIGLPVTILVMLFLLFRKLKDIEGLLKKE